MEQERNWSQKDWEDFYNTFPEPKKNKEKTEQESIEEEFQRISENFDNYCTLFL